MQIVIILRNPCLFFQLNNFEKFNKTSYLKSEIFEPYSKKLRAVVAKNQASQKMTFTNLQIS